MITTIRTFVAVDLPRDVRDLLSGLVTTGRREMPDARWVAPGNLHLTVKFLGETDLDRLAAVSVDIATGVAGLGPAHVKLCGGGYFPDRRRPRVAWIGGEAPDLESIAARVDGVARRHGFDRERRRWRPHLTVARIRRPWTDAAVERFLELAAATELPSFDCRELVLYESRLEPTGAVYTPRERFPLE